MNSIEDACKIETKIVDSLVIINMKLKDIEITDLRMMKFINYFKLLMDDLNDDRIQSFAFVFDICVIKILPTQYIKQITETLQKHKSILLKKLKYSCVVSNPIIIAPFKLILKQFYVPMRPLFLCTSIEETKQYENLTDTELNNNKKKYVQ